jgi:gas vesicle structural protein
VSPSRRRPTIASALIDTEEASLLDVLDSLLNRGVMATGDVVLGVAGVDLIYLRLSTLLTAVDRMMREQKPRARRRARKRRGK